MAVVPHRRRMAAHGCGMFLAVILVTGCDRCTDEPPPLPAVKADAGDLDYVVEPDGERPYAMWQAAAPSAEMEDAAPADLGYQTPPCSLTYEVRAERMNDVAEGRPRAGLEAIAEIVVNPDGQKLTFQPTRIDAALHADGNLVPRETDVKKHPPALVSRGLGSYREVRGPSTLWASRSLLPALMQFFPDLPKSNASGASSEFRIGLFPQATTNRAEARRAKGKPTPRLEPKFRMRAAVHLAKWVDITLGGEKHRAAILVGRWTMRHQQTSPIETRQAHRWVGRWVLSEHGVMIHAALVGNRWQWWSVQGEETNAKSGTTEVELRLVDTCRGPALSRFPAIVAKGTPTDSDASPEVTSGEPSEEEP